jgi:3-dehydrosphinganine reductase
MLRLALAGLLALPALLVTVVMAPILALLSLPACCLLLSTRKIDKPKESANESSTSTSSSNASWERQVIITGGSSGIGLAIALEAASATSAKRSPLTIPTTRIILMARTMEKLQEAKTQILAAAAAAHTNSSSSSRLTVETVSLNVSDPDAVEQAARDIMKASSTTHYITHVFCCAAGEPHVKRHDDLQASHYTSVVHTNQLGSIYAAHAFCRLMDVGTITLTSSMAGQVGVFGYTAYSPTKFALRGFAEALQMELQSMSSASSLTSSTSSKNVVIQLAYPPDTDTPGYALENIGKPVETVLISDAAGLASPRTIGAHMWHEATRTNPRLHVYFNFDGFLLCTLTSAFAPVATLVDAIAQVSILNLTRWIALFYLNDWHRILRNHASTSTKTEAKAAATSSIAPPPPLAVDPSKKAKSI